MKKLKKILIYAFVLVFVFFALVPTFRFKYYYSEDRSRILTRITVGNAWLLEDKTYLTPGYYSKWVLPDKYIKPIYSNDHNWLETIIIHSEGIYIEGSDAEVKNLDKSFVWYSDVFTHYSYARKLDSLKKTFKNTKIFGINSGHLK